MDNNLNSVIVVEDDLILAMVLERMLEQLHFTVLEKCDTGRHAISAVIKHKPDFVLMDIQLRDGIDGISATQEIRKMYNLPVIYITGNSDEKSIKRAQNIAWSDYLIKPVQISTLKKSILKVSRHI